MSSRDYDDLPLGSIDPDEHEVPKETDLEAYIGKDVDDVVEEFDPETPPEKLDTEWVRREDLTPNDWNPNFMPDHRQDLLVLSILDNGWTQPIVAREGDNTIIDGEHRWRLAGDDRIADYDPLTPDDVPAGYVPVHFIEASREHSMIATYQQNYVTGEDDADKLGELIEGMDDEAQSRTATRMGVTEKELDLLLPDQDLVDDTTELWDVPWDDDMDEGNYTDRMALDMLESEAQLVRHLFGQEGPARPIVKLCRFIVESDLYEKVDDTPEPDWSNVPENKPSPESDSE